MTTLSNMILCEALRRRIRHIHFIGIGGIGMSGIAELLCRTGYHISGSDLGSNYNTKRLQKLGVTVYTGKHCEAFIDGADIVVHSSAVHEDNPEYKEAIARNIPIVRRAEMLSELMRFKHSVAVAGSHGKTTTTSMIAALFDYADMDPTTINGGIINNYGTNARLGAGDWIIAEADESDGTFLFLPATVAVITNIDPEHLDHYGDFDTLKKAFQSFIKGLPFYGFAVLCADHPVTQELVETVVSRKIITYGFSEDACIQARDLTSFKGVTTFNIIERDPVTGEESVIIEQAVCNSPGRHNVQNSLAAATIGRELKLHTDVIRKGLASFSGVKRRFTILGKTPNGAAVVDDYAHHPAEVTATLAAAREYIGTNHKIIAIFEPHRYSRLQDLSEDFAQCFKGADTLIIKDIHPAGEQPIPGVTRESFADSIKNSDDNAPNKIIADDITADKIIALADASAGNGDIILCMGAGPITLFAQQLYDSLNGTGQSDKRVL